MPHLIKNAAMVDYFTLFGLPRIYQQDTTLIKQNYLKLQQKMHPDKFVDNSVTEQRLSIEYAAMINEAYKILSSPLKRAIYLLKLNEIDLEEDKDTNMPQDFLIEQMTLHERLAEMPCHPQPKLEYQEIFYIVNTAMQKCEKKLSDLLDGQVKQLSDARTCVRKMQFYSRLYDELLTCP